MNFYNNKRDLVIVGGCGRLGAGIATELSRKGKNVVVIDKCESSFRKLNNSYSGYKVIGDITDISLLIKVGIENADMVVAVSDDDNANIMFSEIADRIYGARKVIARQYDVDKKSVCDDFSIEFIHPAVLAVTQFNKLAEADII